LRKKESLLKNISFESIEDLCLHMADSYDSIKGEDSEDVAVVAKYPEMREIIKELLCIGYDLHFCDIEDEDYDGYCDEYICTIYDNQLWIEKMMRKNGYLKDDSNVIYLLDNCSSKVIPQITSKNIFEVSICDNDDSECDGDCENCDCKDLDTDSSEYTHISREKDGKIAGFTKSWSDTKNGISYYSSYSHYSTDEDALRKVAEDFGIRL
jgi:hypothetical protein